MNKKIALLIAAIVAATSFQISFADEYDRRADAADEIIVSASSDAGEKQSDELMQSPDPDTTAQRRLPIRAQSLRQLPRRLRTQARSRKPQTDLRQRRRRERSRARRPSLTAFGRASARTLRA